MQVKCPKCGISLGTVGKYIYDGNCSNCGTKLRIRNEKVYEQSQIANNMQYSLTVIFGNIARVDKLNYEIYFKFFSSFLDVHSLTQAQYDDLHRVFQAESKGLFHSNYKKIILELKNSIEELFKSSDRMEKIAVEENVFSWVYKIAICTQDMTEEKQEILDYCATVFKMSEERKKAIVEQNTPKQPKKVVNDIDGTFNKVATELVNLYPLQKEFITKLMVAFKRGFILKSKNNYKNLITILSNEEVIVTDILNQVTTKMNDEVLLLGGNGYIDCAEFSDADKLPHFQNALIEQLNTKNEIIIFKNFKVLCKEGVKFLSSMFCDGKAKYNNGANELDGDNRYFVILTSAKQEEFAELVGKDMFSVIGDLIELNELTQEEINQFSTNILNNYILKMRQELNISLFYDTNIIPIVVNAYNKNIGMKSVDIFIEHTIYKALVEFKLRQQPAVEQKVIIIFDGNQLGIFWNDTVIPLDKLLPKAMNNGLEEVKQKLEKVIGLDPVKEYVLKLEDNVIAQKMRENSGLKTSAVTMNMIFTGNPGTGKTTIARIVAEYLKALGVISEGQLVEVSRNDLVGEYQGQTAQKTAEKINSALGGVLFIDEAYALCRNANDTFGLEAIDTIVKMMEDNKNNLVVILAGYSNEMREFLKNNSGLKSRFPNIIDFPDYTPKEMYRIAEGIAKSNDYIIAPECAEPLINYFEKKNSKGKNDSGNGRLARNTVEKAIVNQSKRILQENSGDYQTLLLVDFELKPKEDVNLDEIKEKLNKVIGLAPVKDYVLKLEDNVKAQRMREEAGLKNSEVSMNMIFTGNPGTGKTTIARIVAEYLKGLGVISEGKLVEVSRNDLVGEYQGQTAQKTADKIEQALGGVLFIDEAYALCRNDNDSFGLEAIDTIVKMMEDNKNNLVVILAGYANEMKEFLTNNSGLKSRFPNVINFPDYTATEMYQIAEGIAKSNDYIIAEECKVPLTEYFEVKNVSGKNDSGNGRLARNTIEKAIINQSKRILNENDKDYQTLKLADFEIKEREGFDLENNLSNIIGLDEVKNYIRALAAKIRVNKEREKLGLTSNSVQTLHMIFKGNPGTGKTMMARTVADLLYNLNVISTNNLIETDRAGLVAGYVGQTAQKTTEKVLEALNGVLFIDEAYTLAQGGENDFGHEAIDTLVKLMDDNRDRLVVILAGYSDNMQQFLNVNPGLQSRFPNIVEFKDYNLEQLMHIAKNLFNKNGYELSEDAVIKLSQVLEQARLDKSFGNGRYVRNVFERATTKQALRVSTIAELSKEVLTTITADDIEMI